MRVFYQVHAGGTSPERVFFGPGTPAWGFRSAGRGASLPASPCSFVDMHHADKANGSSAALGVVPHRPLALIPSSPGTTSPRAKGVFGAPGVVPHSPLALIPSSSGTTSPELNESSVPRAWCFTARKPLFLRRRAPRRQAHQSCHKKTPTPPHPRPSEFSSHSIFSTSTCFSSTRWNCPHSHPQFDSHR